MMIADQQLVCSACGYVIADGAYPIRCRACGNLTFHWVDRRPLKVAVTAGLCEKCDVTIREENGLARSADTRGNSKTGARDGDCAGRQPTDDKEKTDG